MDAQSLLMERRVTAGLLILSFITFLVVGYLFTARVLWKLPDAQTTLHLRWERSLVIAAFMVSLLGFALLADRLRDSGDTIFARLGFAIYLVSAATVVVGETIYLYRGDSIYPMFVAHVVLAFLAQAAFGASLLRTGLVASWAGWATLVWNIGLLVAMPIISPRDMYFPWLHYISPLMIGIALLAKK